MASPKDPSPWRYFGLGLELAGAVAVLTWLGYQFDRWQRTEPWGLLTGAMIGIVGGLYNLLKTALAANRDEPRKR